MRDRKNKVTPYVNQEIKLIQHRKWARNIWLDLEFGKFIFYIVYSTGANKSHC